MVSEKVKGKWKVIDTDKRLEKVYRIIYCLKSELKSDKFIEHCKTIRESQLQETMNDFSNNNDVYDLNIYEKKDIDFESERENETN